MSSYNPFVSTFSLAFEELTSSQAVNYYQRRAQEDIDTILGVAIAAYQLCSFVYSLGAAFGEGHYSAVSTHTKAPNPKTLAIAPGHAPVAALAPAKLALAPAPRRHNMVEAPRHEVIVTPPCVSDDVEELIDSIRLGSIMESYTKAEMVRALRKQGHEISSKMRKPEIAEVFLQLA